MYSVVNKSAGVATIQFNLNDENDRQLYISYMKQCQPTTAEGVMDRDRCIIAAGGDPDPTFPGYENMQQ